MNGWTRRSLLAAGSALGAGLGIAGCAAAQPDSGFSSEDLEAVRAPARNAVMRGGVPGAITLVWRRGELVTIDLAGVMDIESARPMQRDALFGVASMSKPVTVAAALTLVEQGVIALDDPITEWAPEFAAVKVLATPEGPLDDVVPAARPITIFDLMTHTSGLGYAPNTGGPLGAVLMQEIGLGLVSPLTPDEFMAALAALPLAYAPGERFHYSHAMDVLGFVIARAAGMSLAEVMRAQLFDPLGMADTGFWVIPEKRDRLATVYTGAALGEFAPLAIPDWVADAPAAYASGGQGLITTADDYLTFARMLIGGGEVDGRRVLAPETVALMTADHMTPAQKVPGLSAPDWRSYGFGLGMAVIVDPANNETGAGRAGAFGWGGGFGGWWQGDPAEDMVLLWLQHALPAPPQPGALAPFVPGYLATRIFERAAYAALE